MKADCLFRGLGFGLLGLSLAGCMGSSGGGTGGGGGGGGATDYESKVEHIYNLGPTINMPTSLKASYTGEAQMALQDVETGADAGEMMADLDLAVDWTEGQTSNVWSGQATNFHGTLNGTDFTATGALAVDPDNSIVERTPQDIPAAGGGTEHIDTSGMVVNLGGDLTINGATDHTEMQLGGAFYGDAATGGALGMSTVQLNTDADTSPETIGTGTFYLE